MGENEMRTLADALWVYFKEKYLLPYLSDSVCFFQATVTTAPSGGVIGVQRPFDNAITLPYAWSASTLAVGDQCTVLMFGDMSNCIVIGDGMLGEPGIYVTKAGLLGSTGQATDNTMTQKAISDALSGLQPSISGTAGQYVGFDANGDPEAQSPDISPAIGSTALITSGGVYHGLASKAPLASPSLSGTPTAPTAAEGTNTTQIATTAFVTTAIKKYSLAFTTADWVADVPSGYYLEVSASSHKCGADFVADVYQEKGASYIKMYGYPSEGWTLFVDASGNINLVSETPFSGKLVIR